MFYNYEKTKDVRDMAFWSKCTCEKCGKKEKYMNLFRVTDTETIYICDECLAKISILPLIRYRNYFEIEQSLSYNELFEYKDSVAELVKFEQEANIFSFNDDFSNEFNPQYSNSSFLIGDIEFGRNITSFSISPSFSVKTSDIYAVTIEQYLNYGDGFDAAIKLTLYINNKFTPVFSTVFSVNTPSLRTKKIVNKAISKVISVINYYCTNLRYGIGTPKDVHKAIKRDDYSICPLAKNEMKNLLTFDETQSRSFSIKQLPYFDADF